MNRPSSTVNPEGTTAPVSDAPRSLGATLRTGLRALVATPHALDHETRVRFRSSLVSALITRTTAFTWLLIALHGPLLIYDSVSAGGAETAPEVAWHAWLWKLHALILGVATSALLALKSRHTSIRQKVRVSYLLIVIVLVWAAWVAAIDQLIGASIEVYLVAALGAALFVTFRGVPTAVAFLMGLTSLTLGQALYQPDRALAISHTINGVGLSFMCWLFARILYTSKLEAFLQRRTISAQHRELGRANTQLHETVNEVTRLNERLSENLALLDRERARSDELLRAVLPERVVERMKRGETQIADAHSEVIVVFADLAGFTQLGTQLTARDLVELLDDLFTRFDAIVKRHGLEKVKTVGDAYLAVAGLETLARRPGHLEPAGPYPGPGDAALDMLTAVQTFAAERRTPLNVRVGIAQGDIVGGVMGGQRPAYDIWGDAVNLASRLENACAPGEILVAEPFASQLALSHSLGPCVARELKGKGSVQMRALLGRRLSDSPG
jgi:class 3 adenylate cyclase